MSHRKFDGFLVRQLLHGAATKYGGGCNISGLLKQLTESVTPRREYGFRGTVKTLTGGLKERMGLNSVFSSEHDIEGFCSQMKGECKARYPVHDACTTSVRPLLLLQSFASTLQNIKTSSYHLSAATRGMRRMSTSRNGKHSFKVEAMYIGSLINIYDLLKLSEFGENFKSVHKGAILIALGNCPKGDASLTENLPFGPYMVLTSYGSAVFFDVSDDLKRRCLASLQQVVQDPIKDLKYIEGAMRMIFR